MGKGARVMGGLGQFMADARKRIRMPDGRAMSQEDLATATGLAPGTIGQIENGRTQRPERDTLEKIAAALGVSYNDLAVAAKMADPPTERDIEAEIRRLDSLPSIEAKMNALKVLSPTVFALVDSWALDLVRQAGQRRHEDNTPGRGSARRGRSEKPGDER